MANVMQVRSSIEVYQSRNIELLLSKALKPLIKSTRVDLEVCALFYYGDSAQAAPVGETGPCFCVCSLRLLTQVS